MVGSIAGQNSHWPRLAELPPPPVTRSAQNGGSAPDVARTAALDPAAVGPIAGDTASRLSSAMNLVLMTSGGGREPGNGLAPANGQGPLGGKASAAPTVLASADATRPVPPGGAEVHGATSTGGSDLSNSATAVAARGWGNGPAGPGGGWEEQYLIATYEGKRPGAMPASDLAG